MLMITLNNVPKTEHSQNAHKLLRECLRKCGIEYIPDKTSVTLGKHGKPYLTDYPNIHFNISHADGIAACIVSKKECGIDCESVRPYRENVVKRAFSESEKALFNSVSKQERDLLFFRLWTLKEAYVKAIGTGITFPLDKAEFTLTHSGIISAPEGFRFRQYIIHGQYVVSVCERLNQCSA